MTHITVDFHPSQAGFEMRQHFYADPDVNGPGGCWATISSGDDRIILHKLDAASLEVLAYAFLDAADKSRTRNTKALLREVSQAM